MGSGCSKQEAADGEGMGRSRLVHVQLHTQRLSQKPRQAGLSLSAGRLQLLKLRADVGSCKHFMGKSIEFQRSCLVQHLVPAATGLCQSLLVTHERENFKTRRTSPRSSCGALWSRPC